MLIKRAAIRVASVFFICLLSAQAYGYHADISPAFKKSIGPEQAAAGRDGVVVFGVLPARGFNFDEWETVNVTREDGAIKRDIKPAHCIPGMCIYIAKIDAGTYQIRQVVEGQGSMNTTTVPLGLLGDFKVESGKITNLGLFGIYKMREKDDAVSQNFDYAIHVDYMGPRDEEYVHQAIAKILADVNPASGVLRWNEDSGFAKRLLKKERTRFLFPEFDKVVAGPDDSLFFPSQFGTLFKFDKSDKYQEIKTGTRLLSFYSLYPGNDFYLLGSGAGRLHLWRPGRDIEPLLDFGIDKVVVDVCSGGGNFYALVLGGNETLEVYRFSGIDAKSFERVKMKSRHKLKSSWRASISSWTAGDVENYESRTTRQGIYVKFGNDKLLRFDPATEKFDWLSIPSGVSISSFQVRDDGAIVIAAKPDLKKLSLASVQENAESVHLQPEARKKKPKDPVAMYASALLLSRDGKKWERLALLSGSALSNIYFADAATAYLVLARQAYSAEKKRAEYVRAQLYKSADGGKTWMRSGSMDTVGYSENMELTGHGKGLAMINKDATQLYVTYDEGKTWKTDSLYDFVNETEQGKKTK